MEMVRFRSQEPLGDLCQKLRCGEMVSGPLLLPPRHHPKPQGACPSKLHLWAHRQLAPSPCGGLHSMPAVRLWEGSWREGPCGLWKWAGAAWAGISGGWVLEYGLRVGSGWAQGGQPLGPADFTPWGRWTSSGGRRGPFWGREGGHEWSPAGTRGRTSLWLLQTLER